MTLESSFKTETIAIIRDMFPGCIIMKNDANYLQGIPDMLILFGKHWAALEFKKEKNSRQQPNQSYYVDLMNDWSYASFIHPENRELVLDELQFAFSARR